MKTRDRLRAAGPTIPERPDSVVTPAVLQTGSNNDPHPAAGSPRQGSDRHPRGVVRTVRALLPRLPWLVSGLLVLTALRATWGVPLQGDDFWLIFSIHADDGGVWANSIDFVSRWLANGTHFNPIGYLLDALLKGGMLASEDPLLSPSVLHHGTIALCALLTVVAVSSLLRRLLVIASDVTVATATLSVPVALGFLAATQLTAPWANYDPLVSHPIYASLTTLVGFAYLSVGLGAVMTDRSRRSSLTAAALGVAGFLIYEMFIVFVVALACLVILYRTRIAHDRLREAVLWSIGTPLLSLVAARIFIATHETTSYAGTEMSFGPASVPAMVISTYTSAPGSLWGASGGVVDMTVVGPFAVAAAIVAGASCAVWVIGVLRAASPADVTDRATGGPAAARSALRTLGPVAVIGVLGPVPFVLSTYWVQVLVAIGQTYMHSLIQLWCWSMVIAVVLLEIARRRWSPAMTGVVALLLTLWVGVQVNVNGQLAADLVAHPRVGVDVTATLEGRFPVSDELRCASLVPVEAAGVHDDWDLLLNREFEERFDEPYCSSAD